MSSDSFYNTSSDAPKPYCKALLVFPWYCLPVEWGGASVDFALVGNHLRNYCRGIDIERCKRMMPKGAKIHYLCGRPVPLPDTSLEGKYKGKGIGYTTTGDDELRNLKPTNRGNEFTLKDDSLLDWLKSPPATEDNVANQLKWLLRETQVAVLILSGYGSTEHAEFYLEWNRTLTADAITRHVAAEKFNGTFFRIINSCNSGPNSPDDWLKVPTSNSTTYQDRGLRNIVMCSSRFDQSPEGGENGTSLFWKLHELMFFGGSKIYYEDVAEKINRTNHNNQEDPKVSVAPDCFIGHLFGRAFMKTDDQKLEPHFKALREDPNDLDRATLNRYETFNDFKIEWKKSTGVRRESHDRIYSKIEEKAVDYQS